jgi:branched-chain amino acid transport system substrate-binding protein
LVFLKEADYIMKRSWSRIFALAMGIPLLLAILAACGAGTTGGGATPTPAGSTVIKIATDLPVSGKDTSSGKPAENGAHLAVDQANANHTIPGYTLVFVPKDDVGASGLHDPTVGEANVRTLIGDALVAGIVGPFNSSVAKGEQPITNRAPIAQISPANTNPCLTKDTAESGCSGANDLLPTLRPTGKVNYFRVATTDDHQGPANADYLYKLNYKKVYVIDDAETYGIGIADAFTKEWQFNGGTLLGRSSEPSSTTSYVSLLTQIAAKAPDVIYFGGLDSTGGILIRQQMLQVPGLKTTPLGGGDGLVTSTFANTIGLGSGGPVYATVATVDATQVPSAKTFITQYDATYGAANFGAYSAAAFDCANILIQAIKTALANGAHTPTSSSDTAGAVAFRTAVINAIQNISFDGVLGHQAFDANGDTTNKVITIFKLGPNAQNKPDWIYASAVTIP